MNQELNEISTMSESIELALLRGLLTNNIKHCSMTLLAMSRIHLITNEEVERIYNKKSKTGRGGFNYGQISFHDDLEQFSENITNHIKQNETIRFYHLPRCDKRDYAGIETDEIRLKLYFDYTNYKQNPNVPNKLMDLSMSKSRYCFASGSRETEMFNFPNQ